MSWTFEAELWLWEGESPGSWTFLALPPDVSDSVDEIAGPRAGFGSVPVSVELAGSRWRTSIFPSRNGFVLPIKKAVRQAEQVQAGDTVRVTITLA